MNGTFPTGVMNGLLSPEHFRAIGDGLWTYLVLIDWQTSEEGWVLGGSDVTVAKISERIGRCDRSVRADLQLLEDRGYVERQRRKNGFVMRILKPKKPFKTGEQKEFEIGKISSSRSATYGHQIGKIRRSHDHILPVLNISVARAIQLTLPTRHKGLTLTTAKKTAKKTPLSERMAAVQACTLCDDGGLVLSTGRRGSGSLLTCRSCGGFG